MQPVQLRLDFTTPASPTTLHLALSGLSVHVHTADANLAMQYLRTVGITPTIGGTLTFPARHLVQLARLPEQVTVTADKALRTIVDLIQHPPAHERPAELTGSDGKTLWLRWFDGQVDHHEPVHPAAVPLLAICDLPFVAAAGTDLPASRVPLPQHVARARMHPDGYIELVAAKPHELERTALPGLFRVAGTRYGIAPQYADAIDQTPGIVWDTTRPPLERAPAVLPQLPMPLSEHAASDLRRLVDALAAHQAQAIVWDSGLGRRVFALAAIDTLDAWPLLIVAPPATVWAWRRHLTLFGRSFSLDHPDADVQIITYEDLARTRPRLSPAAIIFDDLGAPGSLTADVLSGLRRLDVLTDTYRVAISTVWPTDAAAVVAVMSALRPAEFPTSVPLPTRYPGAGARQLAEHVRAYVCARGADRTPHDPDEFRRSRVVQVTATAAQLEAAEAARRRHTPHAPDALLVELLELTSCGSALALSAKVPAVVTRARAALDAGRRVAIVTRHRRTVTLLAGLLRCGEFAVVDATGQASIPPARLVVVRYDRTLPDLRAFDDVLVIDLPWSWDTLDAAVGSAADPAGPRTVSVFHLVGTLDDRLTLLATRRDTVARLHDPGAPPDPDERDYLLGWE